MATLETIRLLTIKAQTLGVDGVKSELDRVTAAQDGLNRSGAALVQSNDNVARSTLSAARQFDVLSRSIDPAAKAQAALARGQAIVNRALTEGAIGTDQAARVLTLLSDRHAIATKTSDDLAQGMQRSAQGAALNRQQLLTLQYTINDVIASASSGISPMTILMQQGGQVTQAFGGVTGTFRALGAYITPTVVGLGSVASVFGLAALAAYQFRQDQDRLTLSLNGVGRAAGVTVDGLRQIAALGAARSGMGIGSAIDGVSTMASAGLSGDLMAPLLGTAKRYAKGTGQELADALKELATAFADPVKGADALNQRLGMLDGRTRELIRSLVAQGDTFGAQQALLAKMATATDDLTTRTGALSKAWEATKGAASGAWAGIGGAVDRMVYGASPLAQLEEALRRREETQSRSRQPDAFTGLLQRVPGGRAAEAQAADNDIMRAWETATAEVAKSIRAKLEAEASKLSLGASDAVRSAMPEIGQRSALADQRGLLERAIGDPEVLQRMGVTADQAREAMARVTVQLDNLKTSAEKVREDGALAVRSIMALTFAERAAVEAERARIDAIREGGDLSKASAVAEAERNKMIAEGNKAARDYQRTATDNASLVGLNPFEKYKRQLEIEDRKFIEQNAPGAIKPYEAAISGSFTRTASAADRVTDALGKMAGAIPGATTTSSKVTASPAATGDVAEMIRQAAIARGIDPNVAVRVAQSEGLHGYTGDKGTSFGPFQLHYGGLQPGALGKPGMGDDFTKATGLDARDPATVQQQIAFALDAAKRNGWGAWYGAAKVGIGQWDGITRPVNDNALASTAAMSRAAGTQTNINSWVEENSVVRIRMANEELARQAALLSAQEGALGKSTAAMAEASARQQMLNEMTKAGIPITDALRASIDAYAVRAGQGAKAAEDFGNKQRDMINSMDAVRSGARDALGTFISDLRAGKSGTEALENALNRLLDKLISFGLDSIIRDLFGRSGSAGGGLLGDLFGNIFGSSKDVGGVVGDGSSHGAMLPAIAWAGAPHFAAGGMVGAGARPIIAHDGEIILNAMQQRNVADAIKASAAMAGAARGANDNRGGSGGVNITVNNNSSGARVEAQETRGANGEHQISLIVRDAIMSDLDRNGPITRAMRARQAG